MNKILLFTNDLELGTTLSKRLLHANKKVIFVDQLYDLDDDADMFIIDLDNVLTMSESTDVEMICYYEDFIKRSTKNTHTKLDRQMGHLGSVNDAKISLEKLFKIDPASKE